MLFFFFKQKTAYEMRISDWSSDVCSSDLVKLEVLGEARTLYPDMRETLKATETLAGEGFLPMVYCVDDPIAARQLEDAGAVAEIGRATSELQSLMRISYAVFCLKKKRKNTIQMKQQTEKTTPTSHQATSKQT